MDEIVQFDFPTDSPKIIKVIGVGGGGGNAVNHMYREGIHDVTFVLCNTDNQALAESPVPVKLQLGRSITQGLGAGNRPERARDAAEESIEDIKAQLNDGTKMVFITARHWTASNVSPSTLMPYWLSTTNACAKYTLTLPL